MKDMKNKAFLCLIMINVREDFVYSINKMLHFQTRSAMNLYKRNQKRKNVTISITVWIKKINSYSS